MISKDILDLLYCCKKHDCKKGKSNRCVVCLLGYSHIASAPLQLECGHVICNSCKDEKTFCFKHDEQMISSSNAYVWIYLFKENQKELFDLLVEQVQSASHFFNSKRKKRL